jgi:hypothetical protein
MVVEHKISKKIDHDLLVLYPVLMPPNSLVATPDRGQGIYLVVSTQTGTHGSKEYRAR